MATRINTQVPDEMDSFVQTRVKHGLFENKSEYMRHLIRKDYDAARKREITLLNKMIQEGINSGICEDSPERIFSDIRKEIEQVAKSKS